MFFNNINLSYQTPLLLAFFIFFSCNDSDSIILNPSNPSTYEIKTFNLELSESKSYRINNFNHGDSPRLYIGETDEGRENFLFLKIKHDLFNVEEELCNQIDDLDKVYFKVNLFMLTDLEEPISNVSTSQNNCYSNAFNDGAELINAYLIDNSTFSDYDEYSDSKNYNQDWIENLENSNLNVEIDYVTNQLIINFSNYFLQNDLNICDLDDFNILLELGNKFECYYDKKYIEIYSSDTTNEGIRPKINIFYSIEDELPKSIDKYNISNIEPNESIATNFISYYTVLEDDYNYLNVLAFNQADQDYNEELDVNSFDGFEPIIDAGYNQEFFTFNLDIDDDYLQKIIDADSLDDVIKLKFNSVSFIYADLDPLKDDYKGDTGSDGCFNENENGIGGCLTLQEEIIYHEIENPDPNGDDWNDCGSDGDCLIIDSNDTQGNGIWDSGEGTEFNSQYDLGEGTEDNGEVEEFEFHEDCGSDGICDIDEEGYNALGTENNEIYDIGETLYDIGTDGCIDQYEDGTGNGCLCEYMDDPSSCDTLEEELIVYNELSNSDPNGDNYNIDPEEDNYDIEHPDRPEGDNEYSIEGNQHEKFIDNGLDQLDDEYEPGYDSETNPDPNGDNWNDCGSDGDCLIIDSNDTQGNGIWESGEGTEKNNRYDDGEWYFDYGYDWIKNENESGYNPGGTQGNEQYDIGETWDDFGVDQIKNEDEEGYDPETAPDPATDDYIIDPAGDNFSSTTPSGTENNGEKDGDENHDDWGIGEESVNEPNYGYNYADVGIDDLFYFFTENEFENGDVIEGEKPVDINAYALLWIDSITKVEDGSYSVSVHLESFIDILAIEIHMLTDYFTYYENGWIEEDFNLYTYGSYDDNLNNEGEKFILDSSIYSLDNSYCDESYDTENCANNTELVLSYSDGIHNDLVFRDDNTGETFSDFIEGFIDNNQLSVFSDEYTQLILYFNLDNENHQVDESTFVRLEFYDEENSEYLNLDNVYVSPSDDYISIPITGLIQDFIIGDLQFSDNNRPRILLSISPTSFNFSKVSIDSENTKIEVFYSGD